ncbi:MAG: hypothetical protein KGH98_00655 [Candidatus Micrarchaeota archaeon]|nr:hypothetical protein [Candidatus Micrarchaeota archaeon]
MFLDDLGKGWMLGGAVSRMVYKDKKLLVYPSIAVLLSTLLTLVVFAPLAISPQGPGALGVVLLLIVWYVLIGTITFYLDMALLIEFRGDYGGKKVGVRSALAQALGYMPYVAAWAIVYGLIMIVLDYVESLVRGYGGAGAGAIFGIFAGFSVNAALLFVFPAIFEDRLGPIEAIKKSVDIVKRRFGQTFAGFAFTVLYALAFRVIGILIIVFAFLFLSGFGAIELVVLIIGLVVFGLGWVFANTFRMVLSLIVYDYLNGKPLPDGIDKQMLNMALLREGDEGGGAAGGGSIFPKDISEGYMEDDISNIEEEEDYG